MPVAAPLLAPLRAVTLAVVVLAATGCSSEEAEYPPGGGPLPAETLDGGSADRGLVANDGRLVVLPGVVDTVLGDGDFTLTPDGGSGPVLVLDAEDQAGDDNVPPIGDRIVVRGIAHEEFRQNAAELQVGDRLDDERYARWVGRPYLEVRDIDPAPTG